MADAGSRTPLEVFERIYRRRRDPWGYESRADEQAKYERTLSALGERRYARALEIGSSIGVFTSMLAARCDQVVGIEPSATALARASTRLRDQGHVELIQAAVPEGLPAGPFDLVVCSEVLYYLSEGVLIDTIAEIERQLVPGATLVAVHYTGPSENSRFARLWSLRRRAPRPDARLSGDQVHELLRTNTQLELTSEERHQSYRLDRFDNPG